MSPACLISAVCFLLVGQSFGLFRERDASPVMQLSMDPQLDKMVEDIRADIQQTMRRKILKMFITKLFQEVSLAQEADIEEEAPGIMPDYRYQEQAEEEADQLSAITRYVGIGYNLLKGSPDGDFNHGGVDPEILTTRTIFDFTYERGKDAFFRGKTVLVPDQVNFQPLESCSAKGHSSAYSGEKSYQKSLNFGIGAGGKIHLMHTFKDK